MKTLVIYYTIYVSDEGEMVSLSTQGNVNDLIRALTKDLKKIVPNLIKVNPHREILISIQVSD